jgi:hypothetical protein
MEGPGLGIRSGRPEEEATAGGRPPAEGGRTTGHVSRLCLGRSRSGGLAAPVGGCGREEGKAWVGLV